MSVPERSPLGPERFYDRIAGNFDSLMNKYDLERRTDFVRRTLSKHAPPERGRLLEVGCGSGAITRSLLSHYPGMIGIDIGINLVRVARTKGLTKGVTADAQLLPIADNSFDLVVSSECIEHTLKPSIAVAECMRVLRIGGVLVLTTPNLPWRPIVRAATTLRLRPYEGHEHWASWADLRGWVEAGGGQVVEHVGMHPLPFQLPLASRWLPWLESRLKHWEDWFINQGICAVKQPPPA